MKTQALSLKVWIGIILCFVIFQYVVRLQFENTIFNPEDSLSISDGQFIRLKQDFQGAKSDELKIAVIGSSRVAKGIECPDDVQNILEENNMAPLQLNKIWESYDPFHTFVEHKNFLKKLIPLKPDLICIQSEMLAIQMFEEREDRNSEIEKRYLKNWQLEYKGDEVKYLPKKLKYQSKVNQELAYNIINANSLFKGDGPCKIHDVYAEMDTLKVEKLKREVKKMEDIQYAVDDLTMLKEAGIKVVIIDVPLPAPRAKSISTPTFISDLQHLKKELKDSFDIDYWEYTGTPLYYKYFADRGHLNPDGRSMYTEWLLGKIQIEMATH